MSIRQTVEANAAVFFLAALAVGFVAGWGASAAIQDLSGRTTISVERLKQLEEPAGPAGELSARIQELEAERANLLKKLLANRPTSGDYVRNIILIPASPSILKVGEKVVVSFDYAIAKVEGARIWATPEGTAAGFYESSSQLSGSGRGSRYFTGVRPGTIKSISIEMYAIDGDLLHSVQIPVNFSFR